MASVPKPEVGFVGLGAMVIFIPPQVDIIKTHPRRGSEWPLTLLSKAIP